MDFSHLYLSEAYIPVEQSAKEEFIVEEATGVKRKKLILEGVYSVADSPNRNNRVYRPQLLMEETKRLNEVIKQQGPLIGELGHPQVDPNNPLSMQRAMQISIDRAAILIEELRFDGKRMYGRSQVAVGTPCGDIVKSLVECGAQIPVSTRGTGPQSNETTDTGAIVVPNGYRMITVDVVTGQSCQEAVMNVIEESYNMLYKNLNMKAEPKIESKNKKTSLWQVTMDFLQ